MHDKDNSHKGVAGGAFALASVLAWGCGTGGPSPSPSPALDTSTGSSSEASGGPTSTTSGRASSTTTQEDSQESAGSGAGSSSETGDDSPVCGNGIIEVGEECDDGNDDNLDVCTNGCRQRVCGDGLVQIGELCDDGNETDDDECTNLCTLPTCGDGILQPPEECDDGNFVDVDGCSNACVLGICGVDDLDRTGICGIEATKRYDPTVFDEAERILPEAGDFVLPERLEVVVGNAGNHTARLSWSVGEDPSIHCCYRGGASVSHPSTPPQINAGLSYILESCSALGELDAASCASGELELAAGDTIRADAIRLSVQHGDTFVPPDDPRTTARAELAVLAPSP